ncbi:MAG: manganese efflux pump [Cellulosilyticaceae bacterium]
MLQIILIVFSLSLDALVISFAYGTNKIKMAPLCQMVIAFISSIVLLVSMFIGDILQHFIPPIVTLCICVALLSFLGMLRLIEPLLKKYLRLRPKHAKEINCTFLGIELSLRAKLPLETKDKSYQSLTLKESFFLGCAVSLDSIALGIGMGFIDLHGMTIFLISFFINILLIAFGNFIGHQLTKKTNLELGWLSGVILILLALSKIT